LLVFYCSGWDSGSVTNMNWNDGKDRRSIASWNGRKTGARNKMRGLGLEMLRPLVPLPARAVAIALVGAVVTAPWLEAHPL
jgi:hypothetical protein